jgi:hypothetical protein
MTEHQRQTTAGRPGGPDMHEVDPESAERDPEAREPGERRLLRGPVKPIRPVGDKLMEVGEVGPERPPGVLGRIRPPGRTQPRTEVLECRGGGLRGKRLGAGRRAWHATHRMCRAVP